MGSKKNKTKTSLALSNRVSPSVENMEDKLTKPYKEVLENWEHDYVEKANERWKENHRNFIKELLFQQDLYDSYKNIKTHRVNLKELPGKSLVVGNKLSTIDEVGSLGHPVEYYVARDSSIPIKKVVTYYGLVDEEGLGGTTTYLTDDLLGRKDGVVTLVPSNDDYTYLDLKSSDMLDSYSKTGRAITLAGSGRFHDSGIAAGRSDDVYEVVEESVVGDADPFGVMRQRKLVRDGALSKEQQMVDLVIKDGSRYYPLHSNKVSALDLAEAKGLSREALRNRVDKRTGQQQISYLYEGYNNNEDSYLPGTYGSFLPEGYDFVVRQSDEFPKTKSVKFLDLDFKGSRLSGSSGKELRALPSTTSSSLLAGTTLDGARPKRKSRYSSKVSTDVAIPKAYDKDYTYLDYLNYPSDGKSGVKVLTTETVDSDFTKPFGLNAEDLDPESPDYFQTVAVDLRRHKLSGGESLNYPRVILPKKVFTDDILGGRGVDGSRRSRISGGGGWVAMGDNTKRYQLNRSSSLEDLLEHIPRRRRYANVPGMATHLAGAIVNDALDRLFGYGGQEPRPVSVYYKRASQSPSPSPPPPPPPPAPRLLHYGRDDARRKRKEFDYELEKEERDRERRKKEREADRQRQLRKLEDDYEKEKRDRERRQDERKWEREQEKKRREIEWEQQQAEWDRQKRQRDREREKLRQERERLDEEARQKAKQKFDPRVHTVITEDIPPATDTGARAVPTEVVKPAPEPKPSQPPPPQRKKMLAEVAEHDPGEVRNEELGHWEGHGHFKDERVIFNSEKGYIYWTKPKGSLEVIFKSPEGHLEFNCKVEPKHEGMKIYEVREDAEVLISNGRGADSLESLEFTAIDGVVVIVLETYEEEEQLPSEFKLLWSLHV